jgi:ACT domain-containing protein
MASKPLPIDQQLDMESAIHNGLAYKDLIDRIKLNVSIQQIADDFGVSRPTVYDWKLKIKNLGGGDGQISEGSG